MHESLRSPRGPSEHSRSVHRGFATGPLRLLPPPATDNISDLRCIGSSPFPSPRRQGALKGREGINKKDAASDGGSGGESINRDRTRRGKAENLTCSSVFLSLPGESRLSAPPELCLISTSYPTRKSRWSNINGMS